MGDLGQDTEVEFLGSGRYRGCVSDEWDLWGPAGGYLASIALRAAGAHSAMARPASFSCHFLSPARHDRVDLRVSSLQKSPRAESLCVVMSQSGRPVLEALVWAVADGLDGPMENWIPCSPVPSPSSLETFVPARGIPDEVMARAPYWKNVEIRKILLAGEFDEPGGEPLLRSWERYVPRSTFDDPWISACRELLSIDVAVFPAAARAFPTPMLPAPSLDLHVAFHSPPPRDEFLLVEARGSAAGWGLVSGQCRIWSANGTLAATGSSQLLCRRSRRPR